MVKIELNSLRFKFKEPSGLEYNLMLSETKLPPLKSYALIWTKQIFDKMTLSHWGSLAPW